MGPDVLVVYDTNLSEEREVTTEEGEKKKKGRLGKAATSLKGDDVVQTGAEEEADGKCLQEMPRFLLCCRHFF